MAARTSGAARELPKVDAGNECDEHRQRVSFARDRMILPVVVVHTLNNPAHVEKGDEAAGDSEDEKQSLLQKLAPRAG